MKSLLAVDIGGTKSHLGLFALDAWSGAPLSQEIYMNHRFSGVVEIIEEFLTDRTVDIDCASLAVAGVIDGDAAEMTNLPWHIKADDLKHVFSFPKVFLVNDLAALAASVALLQDHDSVVLQKGSGDNDSTMGVIAPGTGLGQGFLLHTDEGYIIRGSEGGHAGFAPADDEEIELLRWMMARCGGQVSVEQICSGPGIAELFSFCRETSKLEPAPWVMRNMVSKKDITPAVVAGATAEKGRCPLCRKTLELFLKILGSEAGNLALKLLARGGMYIGGGVVTHLVDKVSFQPFLQAFCNKGKMAKLMATIPVHIITKKDAVLCGAANLGRKRCLQL